MFETFIIPMLLMAVLGGFFGALIAYLSKKLYVQEDTKVVDIQDMLPGINCGQCGYPGCNGFAQALVDKNVDPALCKPGKQEMRDRIRAYLDAANQA